MRKLKSLWDLFISMLKIGLFTFGGGYAMIAFLENEFVAKKKWLADGEFMDLVVIAESTPGPIAINCATYIGYRREGISGATASTLGMCFPSLVIIYLISLFFDRFLAIPWVASAFKGIQVGVILLILSAGAKMLKKMKKSPLHIAVLLGTFIAMTALDLAAISFSSIFFILAGGVLGLLVYTVGYIRSKKAPTDKEAQNDLS